MSYFQLQYDRLLAQYEPTIRPQANTSKLCAIRADISENVDIVEQLRYTSKWLKYLGSCYSVNNDFVTLSLSEGALIILSLYLSAILHLNRCIKLDSYSFVRDPAKERKRMRLNIAKNIETIFNCKDDDLINIQNRRDSRLNSVTNADTLDTNSSGSSSCACRYRQRLRRQMFLRFLRRENIINQLDPGNRNEHAANLSIKIQFVAFWAFFIIFSIISVVNLYALFKLEHDARVSRRLNLIQCQRWHPESVLIRDTMKFMVEPTENVNWTQLASSQQSPQDIATRAARLELTNMLSNKYLLYTFEMIVLAVSSGTWFSIYLTNLFGDYSVRLCWINQIQGQLRDCVRQLDDQSLPVEPEQQESRKRRLEKSLSSTFLNFALFRLESEDSLTSQNFYAEHISLFTLGTLGLGFSILSNIHSRSAYVIYGLTLSTLTIANSLIAVCAIATDRIQKIFHSVNDLLARASTNSMELSYIVAVWRRHILSDSQVMDHYSTSAYGINLSTENLIALDSSILGVWLLIYRG